MGSKHTQRKQSQVCLDVGLGVSYTILVFVALGGAGSFCFTKQIGGIYGQRTKG